MGSEKGSRRRWKGERDVRSSRGIQQNMSVLQILRLRPMLQMLLQTVPAVQRANGRDGCLVDDYLSRAFVLDILSRHVGSNSSVRSSISRLSE